MARGSVRNSEAASTPRANTREEDIATLSELLRRARERRGLMLETIANETKIPKRHLEALESGNWAAMPAGFYQRAEIRAYARAVGVDQSLALAQLEAALKPVEASSPPPETSTRPRPKLSRPYVRVVLVTITAAAPLFWWERTRTVDNRETHADRSLSKPVLPTRDVKTGVVPLQGGQLAPVARLVESAIASSAGPVAAANGVVSPTTETEQARESVTSVTILVVTTQPAGARVTVNGIGWGVSPVTIRYLPPGDKRIRVSKEGYVAQERVLRLDAGRRRLLDIPLASEP